jgi:hypothetical protein
MHCWATAATDLYLDKWVADFKHRIEAFGMSQLLRAACYGAGFCLWAESK